MFHDPDLNFGAAREIDGASVKLHAQWLSRRVDDVEYAVEVGGFILIETGQTDLIATVSGIRVDEVTTKSEASGALVPEERNIVTCTLVGFLRNGQFFDRGIERYPTVGSPAYLLKGDALSSMFVGRKDGIVLGERCQRGAGQELASVDRLFGRHTAILGTSGSGKSWAVASLFQSAMRSMEHTRILFLDLHDEYRTAFPSSRSVRHISASDLCLPHWALNAEEIEELFVSREHAAANQTALLRNTIMELRRQYAVNQSQFLEPEVISVDTPVPYSMDDLIEELPRRNQKGGSSAPKIDNLLMRMRARRSDPRYAFLFRDGGKLDCFETTISTLFGLGSGNKMTILDLSGLPSEVLSVVVGVICRLAFEYKYWDRDPNHLPLTIILEEAHNYLPRTDSARHQLCIDRVERVAKEGRKYGVSLFIVSQRPSEVSETVLSQCANFIALRLTNPNDQGYVKKLLPDFLAVSVDMLPYLRTGEAVFAGEAVDIPTRVKITPPAPEPRSHNIKYLDGWSAGLPGGYSVESVIERWRRRER